MSRLSAGRCERDPGEEGAHRSTWILGRSTSPSTTRLESSRTWSLRPILAARGATRGRPARPSFQSTRMGIPWLRARSRTRFSVAIYSEDGGDGEVPAPDGSPCATYGWLGSTAADDCLTSQISGFQHDFPLVPPCNWCSRESRPRGRGAGCPLHDLCSTLYALHHSHGMWRGVGARVPLRCGERPGVRSGRRRSVRDGGACRAASDAHPRGGSTRFAELRRHYTSGREWTPGIAGRRSNFVFHNASTLSCLAPPDAAAGP